MTNQKSIAPPINDTNAREVVFTNKWLLKELANILDNTTLLNNMAQTSRFFRPHFQEKIDAMAVDQQMALGLHHSIVLMKNGTVKECGATHHWCSPFDKKDHSTPRTISGLTHVRQITAGCSQTFFLLNDGTVKSYGLYSDVLGLGNNRESQLTPITIPGLTDVKQIASGRCHALALLKNGTVKAWGSNHYGGLGLGTLGYTQVTPVTIPGLDNVKQVAAGDDNSLVLLNDGTVKAWGQPYQNIGNNQLTPSTIPELTNVKQISAGYHHALFLLTDGTVKACGCNYDGELGFQTENNSSQKIPVIIPGLTDVKQCAAGAHFSLFLLNDGTVKAVGKNTLGQLGIGNTTDQITPVIIPGLTNVKQIAAGINHVLVILNDGTIKAFGLDAYGQLGLGEDNISKNGPSNKKYYNTPTVSPHFSSVLSAINKRDEKLLSIKT